ncbi:MAG TPA: hypothetical protein VK184_25610 [Nostocaceae cyanobacterium]|nr:hypothetical protein [Nostocaceae cyanobacterium]
MNKVLNKDIQYWETAEKVLEKISQKVWCKPLKTLILQWGEEDLQAKSLRNFAGKMSYLLTKIQGVSNPEMRSIIEEVVRDIKDEKALKMEKINQILSHEERNDHKNGTNQKSNTKNWPR